MTEDLSPVELLRRLPGQLAERILATAAPWVGISAFGLQLEDLPDPREGRQIVADVLSMLLSTRKARLVYVRHPDGPTALLVVWGCWFEPFAVQDEAASEERADALAQSLLAEPMLLALETEIDTVDCCAIAKLLEQKRAFLAPAPDAKAVVLHPIIDMVTPGPLGEGLA